MTVLEDLWMKPFVDQGPVRDETGKWVRGSDPELEFESSEWFLHHTFGPTDPSKGYSPGIYLNRSPKLMTGYSRSKLVLRPNHEDPKAQEDGFETFSCCWVEPLGKWMAAFTKSGPGKRNSRIVFAWADTLAGPWEQRDDLAIHQNAPWNAQRIGESGICWSDSFKVVTMTQGGKSNPPEEKWLTAHTASPDFGANWYAALPFAVPPNVFSDPSGINAMSHSTCAEDPRVPYVLHCVTTHSGRVSADQKGLIQWVFFEGKWHQNPEFLIQPGGMQVIGGVPVSHVGGPSLLYDYRNEHWMMAVHADNKPDGMRRHTRILFEGPVR